VTPRLTPRSLACLALCGGWIVFWAPLWSTARVPYERDLLLTTLPLRHFMRERLLSGHWPQWYPYELLGVPYAGSLIVSPFHPQTLIYLLFSPPVASKVCILAGSLLGLSGAYQLARGEGASRAGAVLAAYVFAFGGFAVSLVNNQPFFIPLMTAPWFLVSVRRLAHGREWRRVVPVALLWALVFLGGDVQLFVGLGAVMVGIVLLSGADRSALLRLAGVAGITACLIAPELLPAMTVAAESIRAHWGPDPAAASAWALPPVRLLDFLFPGFIPFTVRQEMGQILEHQSDLFASSEFITLTAALFLALGVSRRTRTTWFWSAIALVGLWLALGASGGLLELGWKVVPFLAKFRFPEKYVALLLLAAVPLIGLGVDTALQSPLRTKQIAFAAGIALLVVAGLARPITVVHWVEDLAGLGRQLRGPLGHELGAAWKAGALHSGIELLAAGAVLWMFGSGQRVAAAWAVILLVSLALGSAGRIPLVSPEIANETGGFAATLAAGARPGEPPPRVLPARGGSWPKSTPDDDVVHMLHFWLVSGDAGRGHVDSWFENDPAESERALFLVREINERDFWRTHLGVCFRVANPENPVTGVESVVSALEHPPLTLVKEDCGPRAFLAQASVVVKDAADARNRLRQGLPSEVAVWEGGPELSGGGGTVDWIEADADALRLRVHANAESPLVVAEAYAPGWSATVDGSPAPLYPTNGALRGVIVPAGDHDVALRYRSPGLVLGVLLGVLGLLVCAVLAGGAIRSSGT
jgi:hypothetical protein